MPRDTLLPGLEVLIPLAVWFAPFPLEPITKHGFAIVGFMVVAWITRAMDYALAGLVGCFLFWALSAATDSVVVRANTRNFIVTSWLSSLYANDCALAQSSAKAKQHGAGGLRKDWLAERCVALRRSPVD